MALSAVTASPLSEANDGNIRSGRRAEGLLFERDGTSRRDRCDLMLKA